jgi:hypothetical protein
VRVRPVEARQLPGQDLVEDGLVHEGVAEAVPTELVVDDEELVVDAGAQAVGQLVVARTAGARKLDDPGQEGVLDLAPTHGAGPERGRRVGGHPPDAAEHGIAQVWGHGCVRVTGDRGHQFLDEQWVAVGPVRDPGRQLGARRAAEEGAGQLHHFAPVQAPEAHLGDPAAGQLRQEILQAAAPAPVVGAIGGGEHERQVAGAGAEQGDQVVGRAVGPMDVLDHQHQRALCREAVEEAQQQLEDPRPPERVCGGGRRRGGGRRGAGRRTPQRRPERADGGAALVGRQLALQRSQDVDERRVGEAALLQVQAMPDEDPGPGTPSVGTQLSHQTALADPRLPADERGRGSAGPGVVERLDQRSQLRDPPDERRRGTTTHHGHGTTSSHRAQAAGR